MRSRLWIAGIAILILGAVGWLAATGPRPAATRSAADGSGEARAAMVVEATPFDVAGGDHLGDPRFRKATGRELPPPTEIAQWKDERRERRRLRSEWIEELHACPPDVDWRAVEEANRQEASLRRFGEIQRGERTDRWTELGSVNLAGRTHAAAPSPDGQSLYVGSARGGVWKGTLQGQDWQPISDGLGIGSHQLLIVPAGDPADQPQIIFTLTLDTPTVYASADDGLTWFVPEGLPDEIFENRRILKDAADPRTVYFLSRSRHWTGPGTYDYGTLLFRSRDGGLHFEYIALFPPHPSDMWTDRVTGGDLYLLSGTTLHRSADQGETFTAVGAIPTGTISGAYLAGSEAGSPTFYASLKEGTQWKLYRSTNGGLDWSYRYDIHDFWETMNCSITNPDLVFFAGVECWRSTNGGASFTYINAWGEYYGDPQHKLHADNPGLDIHMVNGQEAIYFNTDGGTYVSYDGGATVENLSLWGLGISQYYSTFTSATDPYLIAAGSQDQGYQQSEPDREDPVLYFEQLISGDYGHLTSTMRDHNWLYSVYPGFVLLQKREIHPPYLFQIGFPPTAHSWMPFILADPADSDVFYFCGDHLWRYERQGSSYSYSMTELPPAFAGSAYSTALAFSAVDPDYWFVATNNGRLWYSHDGGHSWAQAGQGPSAHYFYGTALAVSPGDRDVAYVGGSGYGGHSVWRTIDGGLTWQGAGEGLPATLVYGLAVGGEEMDMLFAATEAGPYACRMADMQWENIGGTEAPLHLYWCVEWVPEIGSARFGTYCRGIWDYAAPAAADAAPGTAAQPPMAAPPSLRVMPNPARESLRIQFETPASGFQRIEFFDLNGRRLHEVAAAEFAAGSHELQVDLRPLHLENGIYFVRRISPDGTVVRRIQVLR